MKSGLGHLYQKDVISSLTLQSFVLTLLIPNPHLTITYNFNLGGVTGSLLFGWLISKYGRITLLRQILFTQIIVCFIMAVVGFWDLLVYLMF